MRALYGFPLALCRKQGLIIWHRIATASKLLFQGRNAVSSTAGATIINLIIRKAIKMIYESDEEISLTPALRAERRKNEWKYAFHRKSIYDLRHGTENSKWSEKRNKKPLHYYAKNPPWNSYTFQPNKTNNKGSRRYISKNYHPVKNWNEHDQRQIDNFENQIEELFDIDKNF